MQTYNLAMWFNLPYCYIEYCMGFNNLIVHILIDQHYDLIVPMHWCLIMITKINHAATYALSQAPCMTDRQTEPRLSSQIVRTIITVLLQACCGPCRTWWPCRVFIDYRSLPMIINMYFIDPYLWVSDHDWYECYIMLWRGNHMKNVSSFLVNSSTLLSYIPCWQLAVSMAVFTLLYIHM